MYLTVQLCNTVDYFENETSNIIIIHAKYINNIHCI